MVIKELTLALLVASVLNDSHEWFRRGGIYDSHRDVNPAQMGSELMTGAVFPFLLRSGRSLCCVTDFLLESIGRFS